MTNATHHIDATWRTDVVRTRVHAYASIHVDGTKPESTGRFPTGDTTRGGAPPH